MPNLVGIGNSQVPTNAMLGGLAYRDSVGEINIDKIKAKTGDTAVDVFVYDTRKDSDGGAWRHLTQGTSWYNEVASSIRGDRKEFPVVAIIVAKSTEIIIYDGDDPNCTMWMKFNRGPDSSSTSLWDGNNGNNCTAISAKNGLVMWTTTTAGSYGADFIGERWIYFYNGAPHSGYRGNGKGIADRNNNVSTRVVKERWIGYSSASQHRDIAMTVLPTAEVDGVTKLPSPTIAIATDEGVNIIQSNKVVAGYRGNHGGNYNQVMHVDFDTETNAVIFSDDYGNGGYGEGQYKLNVLPPENQNDYNNRTTTTGTTGNTYTRFQSHTRRIQTGSNTTVPKIQGNYIDDVISAGFAKYGLMTRDSPTTSYPTVYNLIREYDGVDTLQNPTFPSLSQIAYIGSDYNSGWLFSDVRGAFLADTIDTFTDLDGVNYALQATQHATGRLSSESYDDGDVTFHMADDNTSDNGYLAINFNGLTVGQSYKITMTRSAHAHLDTGYDHRIDHNHGTQGQTYFYDWDNNTSSSHVVTGYFVAKTADDDDLVIYTNGAYITISNFKVEETNDAVAKNLLSNGHFGNTSGWTASNATLSVSGGKLRILTSAQGYAYATATTVPGKQYVLSLNLETDGNASLWIQIGSSTHGSNSGGNDLANLNPLGEGTRWGASVMAKSTTTYISLRVSTSGSSKDIYVSDVVFEEAVRDHANSEYSNQSGGGLRVIGGVPKQVVNPGCELLSYGPFTNRNYFQCPNNRASYSTQNKFDDFAQNSMWGMAWINMEQVSGVNVICSGFTRSSGSQDGNQRWAFYVSADNYLGFYQQGGSSTNITSGRTMTLNTWNHVVFVRLSQNSGELHFFLNGVHVYNNSGVTASDLSNANMTINIGTDRGGAYPSDGATGGPFDEGKMSLLRIGRGELTVDIVKQIYEDEKQLFVENAKCSLYGSSDLVTAQAYDSTRDVLHLGTSAGRSDFVGLRRINNTTTAVTTAISASDGLIVEQ